jgi:hypothetical protein
MNPDSRAPGTMLDATIILSVLWVARMLCGLQGDTTRLSDPAAVQSIAANSGAVVMSSGLLLVMSLLFVVPIFVSFIALLSNQKILGSGSAEGARGASCGQSAQRRLLGCRVPHSAADLK